MNQGWFSRHCAICASLSTYLLNIAVVPVVIEPILQVPIDGAAKAILPINLLTPTQGSKLLVTDEVASATPLDTLAATVDRPRKMHLASLHLQRT